MHFDFETACWIKFNILKFYNQLMLPILLFNLKKLICQIKPIKIYRIWIRTNQFLNFMTVAY